MPSSQNGLHDKYSKNRTVLSTLAVHSIMVFYSCFSLSSALVYVSIYHECFVSFCTWNKCIHSYCINAFNGMIILAFIVVLFL